MQATLGLKRPALGYLDTRTSSYSGPQKAGCGLLGYQNLGTALTLELKGGIEITYFGAQNTRIEGLLWAIRIPEPQPGFSLSKYI